MESGSLNVFDRIPRVKQLVVDGNTFTIHCHRYAAISDYFEVILTQEFREKKLSKIQLHGIDKEVFSAVHKLLNAGKIELQAEMALNVYVACRYLLVKERYLQDLQKFILANLDDLEIFELFEYCVINDDTLLEGVLSRIAPRIESLYVAESFKMLSVEAVLKIITSPNVQIEAEDSICWILAAWLAHDEGRKIHFSQLLRRISPAKFSSNFSLEFVEDEWNVEKIADTLYYLIFDWQPRILKPLKSEFFKEDEPLYASNEDGLLIVTHFEGTQWSILDAPRSPIHPSTSILAAAQRQADLYVATSQFDKSSCQFETNVLHYNFRSKKMIEMRKPAPAKIKGLHFINDRLFSNTRDVVQQYCPEHDLWLNPVEIGLSHFQFSTADSQCLYVCGIYDYGKGDSLHCYDPRAPEWIYLADLPHDFMGTCGTFVSDELFVVALGYDVRDWRILKFDVRNCEWTNVMSHRSRNSATPVSIKKCKEKLVVTDHYHNIHIAEIAGDKLVFREHYRFAMKPIYSVY